MEVIVLAVKRPGEDCCLIAVEFPYFGTRGTGSSVLPWSYDITAPPLFGTPLLCTMRTFQWGSRSARKHGEDERRRLRYYTIGLAAAEMTGVCGRAPPVLCGATHGELALLRVSREQHCTSLDPHSMYCCNRSLEIGFLQIGLNGIPFW